MQQYGCIMSNDYLSDRLDGTTDLIALIYKESATYSKRKPQKVHERLSFSRVRACVCLVGSLRWIRLQQRRRRMSFALIRPGDSKGKAA